MMLDKAEQTTQNIMQKYDNDVQKLNKQVNIYFMYKNKSNNDLFNNYSFQIFNKNMNVYKLYIKINKKIEQIPVH